MVLHNARQLVLEAAGPMLQDGKPVDRGTGPARANDTIVAANGATTAANAAQAARRAEAVGA
jgi:hypothetical protein